MEEVLVAILSAKSDTSNVILFPKFSIVAVVADEVGCQ